MVPEPGVAFRVMVIGLYQPLPPSAGVFCLPEALVVESKLGELTLEIIKEEIPGGELQVKLGSLIERIKWYNKHEMKNTNVNVIKKKVTPILRGEGVIRAALFGSVVRGEVTPSSDVDILVEFPRGRSLLDLIRLKRELKQALGKEVDVLTYNSIHPFLKDSILKEQLPIF